MTEHLISTEEILLECIDRYVYSETLREIAHTEIDEISRAVRLRLGTVNPDALKDPEKLLQEAEFDIVKWRKNKLMFLAYGRYCDMMKKLRKKPYTFSHFKFSHSYPESNTPYRYWCQIEEKRLEIGSRVQYLHEDNYYWKKELIISTFTPCGHVVCTYGGGAKTGMLSPTSLERV